MSSTFIPVWKKSVHKALIERIERAELQHAFGQILIPSEEVVEVKNGKKPLLNVVFSQAMSC